MRRFEKIFDQAAARKGGAAALEALLPETKSPGALAAIADDRYLAAMTRAVFNAGFNWSVIAAKWPDFEAAFEGFSPPRWAMMNDEDLDRLLADKRIVRNAQKILAVRDNAQLVIDLGREFGGAGAAIGNWPASDFIGLLAMLKARGGRLGGNSAQYFLRAIGKDGFMLSADVTAALIREGVVDKATSGKRDRAAVQAAFDRWREESGRSLAAISRVLACSVGA